MLLFLCAISCEKTITYESDTDIYTSENIDVCAHQSCPTIDLSILKLKKPVAASTIVNSWIKDLTISSLYNDAGLQPSSIGEALDTYINNSQISYPETSELSDAHEISIESAISFGSNSILSVVFYSYQFSGGASGFDNEMYLNLNPQTGEEYEDDTVFKQDFYAFAKAQFKQEYPNEIFNFTKDDFLGSYLKEVGFTEEGVVLIYNDMGMESMSMENKQITIPWINAEDYLTF